MQRQGSGGVETAYQRWKSSGQPRPYLREVVVVERFDFFALASLLLAVAVLGWWLHAIYKVAFPEPKGVPVTYSGGGASLFAHTPTPTPTPALVASRQIQPSQGGGPHGGAPLGGTRAGGTPVGLYLMVAGGAFLALAGFLGTYVGLRSRL
jgi:hypothetical protein